MCFFFEQKQTFLAWPKFSNLCYANFKFHKRTAMTRNTVITILMFSALLVVFQAIIGSQFFLMAEVLWLAISVLVILSLFLQRSRAKHKQAEIELEQARKELQFLVVQRTRRLNELNQALQNEVRLQEHTSKRLQSANDLLDSILTSMPSMLIALTPEGVITHWNRASEFLTGIKEQDALDKNLMQLCPDLPVDWDAIHGAITSLVPSSNENISWRGIFCDVSVYPLQGGGAKGAVVRIDDVTTRTTVETMLIHNEKMMSLGEMAAGTAHEVNNPLATILQNAQNAERRLFGRLKGNASAAEKVGLDLNVLHLYLKERDVARIFSDIRDAGQRATDIVTNMLSFARKSGSEFEATDLCELVNNTLVLARQNKAAKGKGRDKVKFVTNFEESPIIVKCLPNEIQQVLLNLITNAEQALQGFEPNDGRRTISVSVGSSDDSARIEVRDNGPGIPSEQRSHIFQPFYTTKNVGSGTGLGLSVSYFIVTKHHGGSIYHEPARGGGCVFVVNLPKQDMNQHLMEADANASRMD